MLTAPKRDQEQDFGVSEWQPLGFSERRPCPLQSSSSGLRGISSSHDPFSRLRFGCAKRLLGCRDAGFVPWRLGHVLLCVPPSCDEARLVRRLAAPAFLGALGIDLDLDQLLVYRLGHWKDLLLGSNRPAATC